jgi:hypothetical protein
MMLNPQVEGPAEINAGQGGLKAEDQPVVHCTMKTVVPGDFLTPKFLSG